MQAFNRLNLFIANAGCGGRVALRSLELRREVLPLLLSHHALNDQDLTFAQFALLAIETNHRAVRVLTFSPAA